MGNGLIVNRTESLLKLAKFVFDQPQKVLGWGSFFAICMKDARGKVSSIMKRAVKAGLRFS
ncbi:hypothetical protein AAW31_13945 [Nitrosomonas communis]|uniref:Uncharacterized protein n=1 Tax=Nitrosomonas communis TaxID=44574 RepID=A0A0F7KHP2_9PROT|nr:hypothetical protein AAW31_13945 [Nitrosomonas communis]